MGFKTLSDFPKIDESVIWYQTGTEPVSNVIDIIVQVAVTPKGLYVRMIQAAKDGNGQLQNAKIENSFKPIIEDKFKTFFENHLHESLSSLTE